MKTILIFNQILSGVGTTEIGDSEPFLNYKKWLTVPNFRPLPFSFIYSGLSGMAMARHI
jgi:hypothetical protein